MCLSDAYMIIEFVDQYMNIIHNKRTLILSVAMNIVMVDMHTLWSWTCKTMFDGYVNHAV